VYRLSGLSPAKHHDNAIIRLVFIDRYSRFKYKRVRNNGPEWEKISENNGGSDKANMRH